MILLCLIFGLLMAGSALAANPIDSLGDTISNLIGKIGSLSFLGGSEAQLLGFLRILYGILVFTLMYLAFHGFTDKVPKNIAITLSIILAIMVVIFTPGTVLIAIAGSYSVAAATVIFGGLLGAAIWFVIGTKTETWFAVVTKIFLLLLVTWLVGQFDALLVQLKLGTAAALGTSLGFFGTWVDFITDYAYLVFFLLMVWVILAFIFSRKGGEWGTGSSVGEAASGLGGKILGKFEREKVTAEGKKVGKKAKKAEEWGLLEFTDLKKLQKDVVDAKTEADLNELLSDERVAERHEKRAYKRILQVEKLVQKAKLSPDEKKEAEKIVKEMDIFNKLLLRLLTEFNIHLKYKMAFEDKQRDLSKILGEAIEADQALVAEFEKLKKLFK